MIDRARQFVEFPPRLANWLFLSAGMVILFLWAARGQPFTAAQWAGLMASSIMLAGACAWIIGWET